MKVMGIGVLFWLAPARVFALVSERDRRSPRLCCPSRLPAAASAASAQDVYLDKCSVCHAKDGSGNTGEGQAKGQKREK